MGEYIADAPNHDKQTCSEVAAIVAGIIGVPAEKLGGVVILAEVENAMPGKDGLAVGANFDTEEVPHFLYHAMMHLGQGLVMQAIADQVPDDLSELDGLGGA